jgi:hypothetical protein
VPFTNPNGSEGVDLYLDREAFLEAFCADVDPEMAAVMAWTQRLWSGAGAATPSGPAGWRSIPSWYLLGTEDQSTLELRFGRTRGGRGSGGALDQGWLD